MITITLQDRHALLLHALLKRTRFMDALKTCNTESKHRFGGHADGTDICLQQFPAEFKEVDAAIGAACSQLKYQLNA